MAEENKSQNKRTDFSKTEIAYLAYRLILPKLKILLAQKTDEEDSLGKKSNIEVIKVRLKKILENPKYFKIKNILVNGPLWDNDLNILAYQLQHNV